MWLKYGAKMALVMDPETETIIVHEPNSAPITLTIDDVLDLGGLLPGFSSPVRSFFHWGQ